MFRLGYLVILSYDIGEQIDAAQNGSEFTAKILKE
jgi:hypothetical protein